MATYFADEKKDDPAKNVQPAEKKEEKTEQKTNDKDAQTNKEASMTDTMMNSIKGVVSEIGKQGENIAKVFQYGSLKAQNEAEQKWISSQYIDDDGKAFYSMGEQTGNLNLDFKLYSLNNIFGLPYAFDDITDPPLEGTTVGRIYLEKIISKMPILVLTPGLPSFLAGESAETKSSLLSDLGFGSDDNLKNLDSSLKTNGKYYSLTFAAREYFQYVDTMCRALAAFLGIHKQKISIGKHGSIPIDEISWLNVYERSASAAFGYYGGVGFYVNAETSSSESWSNETTESMLKSKINEFSAMGRELQFVTGTLGLDSIFAKNNGVVENPSKDTSFGDSKLGAFISNLMGGAKTIFAGGKLLFPDLWSDSSYNPPSTQVQIRLISPNYNKVSWFLDIGVPLIHLIALTAPRAAGANGYASPFLVRAFYKGIFNVDMGVISSLSLNKGQEGAWTIDGLPTIVDVSLEIKDLYSKFAISKTGNGLGIFSNDAHDFIENSSLITYLANMAGVNINMPDISRVIALKQALFEGSVMNVGNSIQNRLTQSFYNKVNELSAKYLGL